MPTNKKRIYVTLSKELDEALQKLALRDETAPATKAAQLLQFALEVSEEDVLDTIASHREETKSDFISHEEAWQ